jgi:transcriptional regulator with XRE-family HTH domain
MDIAKRIVELRIAKGLTQYKLIQLSGVKGLSQYENGKAPGPDVLEKICAGLGVTLAEFYDEAQTPQDIIEDSDIREIARARKDMTPEQRARMMKIIKASFEEFFGEKK